MLRHGVHRVSAGAIGPRQHELRALPHTFAVRAHAAACELHHAANDEQPEARALIAAAAARMQSREFLEQLRRHPWDGNPRPCRGRKARSPRRTRARLSVMVPPPTGATAASAFSTRLRITTSTASGSASTSSPRGTSVLKAMRSLRARCFELTHHARHCGAEIDGLALEVHAAALETHAVENARDERLHARDVREHALDERALFRWRQRAHRHRFQ